MPCHAVLCCGCQVRSYIRKIAKPGIPLTQLCETLEDGVRNLIEARGLDAGEGQGVRGMGVSGLHHCLWP